MKVGNIVDGLAVIDVKRINKMNLIQFTKAVSEYIEQGYKIDVHSSRQVGLVLQCDMYKLENNFGVGSTGESAPIEDSPTEDVVKEPNETKCTPEAIQESTEKLEAVEVSDETINAQPEQEEETTPPVKKTRTKKTT